MQALVLALVLVGCRAPHDAAEPDDDAPLVTCNTNVVPAEPCVVAADGSGTYTSIQEAVDAASAGDAITVCPGYYDSVILNWVPVTLAGYGADSTCIIGTSTVGLGIYDVEVEVSGFTISGEAADPAALHAVGAAGTVRDVRIAKVPPQMSYAALIDDSELDLSRLVFEYNGAAAAVMLRGGRTAVRHSVFRMNGYGLRALDGANVTVTNSIFTRHRDSGFHADHCAGTTANNVFYDNASAVVVWDSGPTPLRLVSNVALANGSGYGGSPSDSDFNVAWENGADYGLEYEGTPMMVDPAFEDAAALDFQLLPGSALIDAGDPDPSFADVDGSRNDIGLFGGPYGDGSPP